MLLIFSVYFKVTVVSRKVSKELTYTTKKDGSQNYSLKPIMLNYTPLNLDTNFSAKIAKWISIFKKFLFYLLFNIFSFNAYKRISFLDLIFFIHSHLWICLIYLNFQKMSTTDILRKRKTLLGLFSTHVQEVLFIFWIEMNQEKAP